MIYVVIWKRLGETHLCDFDDPETALIFARLLEEAGGRTDVLVSGPQEVEVDAVKLKAIKDRLERIAKVSHYDALLAEAAGGMA